MLRLSLVIFILATPPAGVAAYAQGKGGAVSPELGTPTRGQLLNSGLSRADWCDRAAARGLSIGGSDRSGPLDRAAG